MQIFIKTFSGKILTIDTYSDERILNIKNKIYKKEGILPDN